MRFEIKSLERLPDIARQLIDYLGLKALMESENCIAFYGEMGAGKTTLIKELCKQLGINDATGSPSFSLVNEYLTGEGESVFHFDFYRINDIEEAYDLGYEDYFYSNSLCLIEWPEKIEPLLPENHIQLKIKIVDDEQRIVELTRACP
jgi:tRNA threonylcarbamoyladenosine biosynthesis protein TsaE